MLCLENGAKNITQRDHHNDTLQTAGAKWLFDSSTTSKHQQHKLYLQSKIIIRSSSCCAKGDIFTEGVELLLLFLGLFCFETIN
jgi:hypothetical protein